MPAIPQSGRGPIYLYNQNYDLVAPAINAETAVDDSGPGFVHTLLAAQMAPGGIRANRDFVVEYEGFLFLDIDRASIIVVVFRFKHTVGGAEFASERRFRRRMASNEITTIPLSAFNSRTQVPLGEFVTQDGTMIAVTQAVLDAPLTIELEFELMMMTTGDPDRRISGNIESLSGENLRAHYWQI